MKTPVVIHNVLNSNFANLMIKYVYARKLQRRLNASVLSNYVSDVWGFNHPAIAQRDARPLDVRGEHQIDHERIAYLGQTGLIDRIDLHGHLQRMENLLPREECNEMFQARPGLSASFGDNFIVCPIRGAEILDAIHPGYVLLPVNFYRDVFSGFRLTPVFMGQTDRNSYTDALRAAFPDAIFLPSQGPLRDFQTIRTSANIVLPVSTFAWMAAWLSEARTVILPVFGLFNPQHYPENDLLPLGDPRYRFYQFPVQAAVKLSEVDEAHRMLAGSWVRVSDRQLMRL